MMNDNNNFNITAVEMHDTTVPLRVEKNQVYKVKESSVGPPAEDRANHKDKKEEISDVISNLERSFNRAIRFEIDSELDAVIVKVIDKESGDVIRQIPSEELVELSKKIKEHNLHILDVVA